MVEVKKQINITSCPSCGGDARLSKHTAVFVYTLVYTVISFSFGIILPFLWITTYPAGVICTWSFVISIVLEMLGFSKIKCNGCGSTHFLGFKESRKAWRECKLNNR